jgi:putative ABC transport system permease protein
MTSVKRIYGGRLPATWVWNPCWTYFTLHGKASPDQLEKQLPDFVDKYFYDAEKDNIILHLQKLTDIHLNSRLDYEIEPNNHISYIYILGGIGIFLLIIAIINFTNLSTATSANRAKEIGMKKVVGAYRTQLIVQFMGESLILTLIALLIALIIVEIALPFFNNYTQKEMGLDALLHITNIASLVIMVLAITLLSGLYPAIYLSKFNPIQSLRGSPGIINRSGLARKILVVTQFTISIGLIICTIIIFKQINYLKKADLGFDKENIIVVPVDRTSIINRYEAFKGEIMKHPAVISMTAMDDIFGSGHNTHEFRPEGFPENEWAFYPALVVQYDFIKTFGIDILAGRDYEEANKSDPIKGILINEAMVKHMGWENNEAALGKKFRSLEGDEKVIGIIDNFHATSLHKSSGPFVINMKESPGSIAWFLNFAAIKVADGKEKEVLAHIEEKWQEFAGNRPFEYFFLENELKRLYKDEENLGLLALVFTLMIIFIAGLGLYGLSSYMADKRTKEIGIRKVMGASSANIVSLLSVEFVKLILMANVIAWPLAWLVIDNWLSQFAYRTSYGIGIFIFSGLAALVIALIITSVKATLASRLNPVDTLKYE